MNTEQGQNSNQSNIAANAPVNDEDMDALIDAAIGQANAPANAAAHNPSGEPAASPTYDPAPGQDPAATPPAAAQAPAGSATDNDWVNDPAKVRERFEALQRDADLRLRSAHGRLSAADRELNALRSRQPQQQPQEQPQGTQPPAAAKVESDHGARFKQLREDYPEVAGPILDYLDELVPQVREAKAGAEAFQTAQNQAALTAQEQALTSAHPDWLQAATDDRFGGWLQTQPQSVREAFARNETAIVDAGDAALVIDRFKQAVKWQAPASAPPPPPAQDDRRQRQLAAARDTRGTAPSAVTGIPNDEEAAVDYWISRSARG